MSSRRSVPLLAISATLILHFVWEMLHAPAFERFAGDTWAATIRCLRAALGDLLLAGGAYAVAALVYRQPAWLIAARNWTAPAVTWIVVGLVATIVFELWATDSGRWRYGFEMPTLFGVGLLPLLQWLIVPTLTIALVRGIAKGR